MLDDEDTVQVTAQADCELLLLDLDLVSNYCKMAVGAA